MITAQVEKLSDSLQEMKWLFPEHWKELALNQDKIPLDPLYDQYLKEELEGSIVYVTIREDGDIVGYFVGNVGISKHYRSLLMCTPDIFYVHPEKRHQDIGTLLFNTVEIELKRRGVRKWLVGDKNHKLAAIFFEKLGFEKIENIYSKWLGE